MSRRNRKNKNKTTPPSTGSPTDSALVPLRPGDVNAPAVHVGERHELTRHVGQAVERAAKSQQPRFSKPDSNKFYGSVLTWLKKMELSEPPYSSNSQVRDTWLNAFFKSEPHLSGIVYSASAINKNRGWTLVGGKIQVNRFLPVFHGIKVAPDKSGWRSALEVGSESFYATDLGWPLEIGRAGKNGPMAALYHADPTCCELTGNNDTPLMYHPKSGSSKRWRGADYMRIVSLIDIQEKMNGLGYCAISRGLELAKIMVAVYQHDQEMLGAKAPKGLLLLSNISQEIWDQAMTVREAKMESLERKYFGGVAVLASSGIDQMDAKLIGLSQLPAGFDLSDFTDYLMYGLSLCFGYDPSEFWPVNFGALGRGTEAEQQSQKASGKGGQDFCNELQESLQQELPLSLQFGFDERDDQGDLVVAQVEKAKAEVITEMNKVHGENGLPILTDGQWKTLWATKGLIPPEWAEDNDNVEASDVEANTELAEGRAIPLVRSRDSKRLKREQEKLRERPHIMRAIEQFPNEPIVRYHFKRGVERMEVIWESGHEARRRTVYPGGGVDVARAADDVLFEGHDVIITQADVDKAVRDGKKRVGAEFEELLTAPSVEAV